MKKKLLFGLSLLVIGIVCGYIFSRAVNVSSSNNLKVYTGYLSCQSCAASGQSMDCAGIDIRKYPEKHTVNCLRMYTCVTSGFGIFIKNDNGSYTYYKFDKKGSDLAYQNVVSQTKKTDNMLVEVTGKMHDNILSANRITEK